MKRNKYNVTYEFNKVTQGEKMNRVSVQKMSGSCEIEYDGKLTATKELIDFLTNNLSGKLSAKILNLGIQKIEKVT